MARALSPYLGVYESIEFPDYKYQHYPLMMNKGGVKGESLIVANQDEETAAKAAGFEPPERVGPPKSLTESEFKKLEGRADELEAQLREALAKNALLEAAIKAPAKPQAPPAKPST